MKPCQPIPKTVARNFLDIKTYSFIISPNRQIASHGIIGYANLYFSLVIGQKLLFEQFCVKIILEDKGRRKILFATQRIKHLHDFDGAAQSLLEFMCVERIIGFDYQNLAVQIHEAK